MKILGFVIAFLLCFTLVLPAQADVTLPPLPVPTVTVSLPPVTLPPLPPVTKIIHGPTVYLPRPTKTVTLFQPGSHTTRYVNVPGATSTKTIYLTRPPATKTVTKRAVVSEAPTPSSLPTSTVTSTVTTRPTRQTATTRVTVSPDQPGLNVPPVHLNTPAAVGFSLVAVLVLSGLMILGMWLGYILGYKDSERKEMKFLRALRDQFYYSGKHR